MAKHNFKYYLHETGDQSEVAEDLIERAELPEEIANFIAQWRPFYEVEFDCVFDDITKHLTVQAHFQECLTSA